VRLFLFCARQGMPWRLAWAIAGALDKLAGAAVVRGLEIRRHRDQASGPEELGP
jgi:hypothetical protein